MSSLIPFLLQAFDALDQRSCSSVAFGRDMRTPGMIGR
jgi:hypothetical protein